MVAPTLLVEKRIIEKDPKRRFTWYFENARIVFLNIIIKFK
jgi:hypothetical protein